MWSWSTSRPRESALRLSWMLLFLFLVLLVWRRLLDSSLRCCFDRFACRTPTWRLLVSGGVGDLVTAYIADGHRVVPAAGRREVFGVRNSGL